MHLIQKLTIEHLDLWVDAEVEKSSGRGRLPASSESIYGVRKLRELILQLASSGKLVNQNPSNQSAREALIKFHAENKSSVKKQQINVIDSAGSNKVEPFDLPSDWTWAYLPELAKYGVGKTPSTKVSAFWSEGDGDGVSWVSIADLNNFGYVYETSKKISHKAALDIFRTPPIPAGTLLMSFKLTLGKISILGVPAFHNEAIISIFPNECVLKEYLFRILPSRARLGNSKSAIKGDTLNADSIALLMIPLPPLEEQVRIVAKVDELMLVCDQLEMAFEASTENQIRLVKSCINKLIMYSDIKEFLQNFHELFISRAGIQILKASILELGVGGHLTPNDSDANQGVILFNEVITDRKLLIASRLIKDKGDFIDFAGLDSLKGEIPNGWCWVRLGEIAEVVRGGSPRPAGDPRFYDGHIPFLKVGDVTRSSGKMVEGWTATIKEAGLHKTRLVKGRTVLLTNSGATLGVPAICDFETTFNDGIAAFINLSKFVYDEYLHLYLVHLSDWFLNVAAQGQGQPNLNIDIIRSTWMPLPPMQEQLNIVSKVDQLLATCNQLELLMEDSSKLKRKIADVLIERTLA